MNRADQRQHIDNFVGDYIPPYVYNAKQFIAGKTPVLYSGPYWDGKEIQAAVSAMMFGKWVTSGEHVYKFERKFAKYFGTAYGHMVNSGSSANLVMIAALKEYFKWNDGDEIIVSPVGFATTISVIYQHRLKPVFIDVEWDTLNFDVNQIENKITSRTRGIFVSPVLGNPPDMDRLKDMADRYGLQLIGDNCDSLGSKWEGSYLSDFYIAYSNSFYPAHHISTGEGGMCCTNKEDIKKLFVSLSWWGRDCHCVGAANLLPCGTCGNRFDKWLENYDGDIDHKYVFQNMGYNLKPLDLQGAIGLVQLDKFEEIERKRKYSKATLEAIFKKHLKHIRGVKSFDKADVSWFGVPFICEEEGMKHKLVHYLESHKIQTRNYFAGNILLHPGYAKLDDYKNYPEANKVLDRVFFIGAAPHYGDEVFDYVNHVMSKFK